MLVLKSGFSHQFYVIYKKNVVHESLLMDGQEDYNLLLNYQEKKPYKKIGKTELLKWSEYDYYEMPKQYTKLRKFLVADVELMRDDAENICFDIYLDITTQVEKANTMEIIQDYDIEIDSDQFDKLSDLLVECNNNTPLWVNRGYTPVELALLHYEQTIDIDKKEKASQRKKSVVSNSSKHSYVITASCGSGCYRHIKISENATLFELHEEILYSVGFIDDHAHVFFMNNIAWDRTEGYYSDIIEDEKRFTSDYTLKKLKLEVGDKFKYIFDFGYEWLFQCKVLKKLDEDTEEPEVIRSKGEIEQYGYYDEDEDE
ncbi:MAG TPA: hypothetical protein DDZ99_05125 [Clostridiales bacterium]|nr:hypothetical protein [Clostridiales bacterium]